MKRSVLFLTLLAGVLLLAISVNADTKTLSYQGRLLDSSGDPVSDGNYTFEFRIFQVATAGSPIFTETGRVIPVADGLFTTEIGVNTLLNPSVLYDEDSLWLEVKVAGETLSPRTFLAATMFAKQAEDIRGQNTSTLARVQTYSVGSSIKTYGSDGNLQVNILGPLWGEMFCYDASASNHMTAALTAEGGQTSGSLGGALFINSDAGGAMTIDASSTGDGAVQFWPNTINSGEMLNEPGVATQSAPNFVYLNSGNHIYVMDSVTITIPTSGYVVLNGGCYVNAYHVNGTQTRFRLLVDDTRAYTGVEDGLGIWSMPSSQPTSSTWQVPLTSSRTFAVTAGTHKFYLNFEYEYGASTNCNVGYGYIRALFVPTLYGDFVTTKSGVLNAGLPIDGSVAHAENTQTITVEDHQRMLDEALAAQREDLERRIQMIEARVDQMNQQAATE